MRRFRLGLGVLVVLAMAPAMFADITDYMLNIGGTTYCASYGFTGCANQVASLSGIGGVTSSIDETGGGTGLGAVSFTFNPGPGTYNVDFWIFEQLSGAAGGAAFNEYGQVNGSAGLGQSYQIDVPDYDYTATSGDPNFGFLPAGAGSIISNTAGSTLANFNYVTGNTDQDLSCTGLTTCNDFTSMALGFNFTLAANQEELLSFTVSNSNPGGFNLQQIHPANDPNDGGGNPQLNAYFSGSATEQTIGQPPPVPEPGSVLLLATLAGILAWAFRPRSVAGNTK